MTTNHIDQLAQWWENAEEGVGKAGDVVIERDDSPNFGAPSYVVFMLGRDEHENLTYRRILARAPKPKPAWHDAVAVIAHTDENPAFRDVWVADNGEWRNSDGDFIDPADLRAVTPLIEAKVTDEMVERARDWLSENTGQTHGRHAIRHALDAALGIETK